MNQELRSRVRQNIELDTYNYLLSEDTTKVYVHLVLIDVDYANYDVKSAHRELVDAFDARDKYSSYDCAWVQSIELT